MLRSLLASYSNTYVVIIALKGGKTLFDSDKSAVVHSLVFICKVPRKANIQVIELNATYENVRWDIERGSLRDLD